MPPPSEVLDALLRAVLPAAATAGILFALLARLLPRRFAPAAGALALVAGFLAANHFRGAVEFRLDSERLLSPAQLASALRDTFVPPASDDLETPLPPPARYWLPWTAVIALVAGLIARGVPPWIAGPIRIAASAAAAALLVAPDLRAASPWLVPLLVALILALWATLERENAARDDGDRDLLPITASAFAFLAASVVLLHAHSARFTDVASILFAALAGIGAAAWWRRADPSGAMPAVAVALPGLMLVGRQDTFSEVPVGSFALVALAPLALALLLLPHARRRPRAFIGGAAALFLALLAAGVALAARAESLSFE